MYKKPFCHLAIWQNWCFGQFYQSKIEKLTFSNLSFLWSDVFLREREEMFSTYFEPKLDDKKIQAVIGNSDKKALKK